MANLVSGGGVSGARRPSAAPPGLNVSTASRNALVALREIAKSMTIEDMRFMFTGSYGLGASNSELKSLEPEFIKLKNQLAKEPQKYLESKRIFEGSRDETKKKVAQEFESFIKAPENTLPLENLMKFAEAYKSSDKNKVLKLLVFQKMIEIYLKGREAPSHTPHPALVPPKVVSVSSKKDGAAIKMDEATKKKLYNELGGKDEEVKAFLGVLEMPGGVQQILDPTRPPTAALRRFLGHQDLEEAHKLANTAIGKANMDILGRTYSENKIKNNSDIQEADIQELFDNLDRSVVSEDLKKELEDIFPEPRGKVLSEDASVRFNDWLAKVQTNLRTAFMTLSNPKIFVSFVKGYGEYVTERFLSTSRLRDNPDEERPEATAGAGAAAAASTAAAPSQRPAVEPASTEKDMNQQRFRKETTEELVTASKAPAYIFMKELGRVAKEVRVETDALLNIGPVFERESVLGDERPVQAASPKAKSDRDSKINELGVVIDQHLTAWRNRPDAYFSKSEGPAQEKIANQIQAYLSLPPSTSVTDRCDMLREMLSVAKQFNANRAHVLLRNKTPLLKMIVFERIIKNHYLALNEHADQRAEAAKQRQDAVARLSPSAPHPGRLVEGLDLRPIDGAALSKAVKVIDNKLNPSQVREICHFGNILAVPESIAILTEARSNILQRRERFLEDVGLDYADEAQVMLHDTLKEIIHHLDHFIALTEARMEPPPPFQESY